MAFSWVKKTKLCLLTAQHTGNLDVRKLIYFSIFQMRFLDCREGRKDPSKSILDVGVKDAICFSGFDEKMFFKRGGKYLWSKADMKLEWWKSATAIWFTFPERLHRLYVPYYCVYRFNVFIFICGCFKTYCTAYVWKKCDSNI